MVNDDQKKEVGTRLKHWRKALGFKLSDLTHLIDISQGSLSELENNLSLPSSNTLIGLHNKTDLNIIWLLTGQGNIVRDKNANIDISTEQKNSLDNFLHLMDNKHSRKSILNVIKILTDGDKKQKKLLNCFVESLVNNNADEKK